MDWSWITWESITAISVAGTFMLSLLVAVKPVSRFKRLFRRKRSVGANLLIDVLNNMGDEKKGIEILPGDQDGRIVVKYGKGNTRTVSRITFKKGSSFLVLEHPDRAGTGRPVPVIIPLKDLNWIDDLSKVKGGCYLSVNRSSNGLVMGPIRGFHMIIGFWIVQESIGPWTSLTMWTG